MLRFLKTRLVLMLKTSMRFRMEDHTAHIETDVSYL
jgi:hypothetical protein